MSERPHLSDMRQRLGLAADDPCRDAHIDQMSATSRLGLIAGWHLGYSGWEHTILNWVRAAGFKVSEPDTRLEQARKDG